MTLLLLSDPLLIILMYSSLGSYGGGGFGSLGSSMYGMGSSFGSGYGSLRPGGESQQNQQQCKLIII